jgi:hypothetical protein
VLLDEWKYRHNHCWSSLRQYIIAAVAVSIVPYVKSDLIQTLGRTVLLFPFVGWVIVVGAILLFEAEYARCHDAEAQYHWLLGPSLPGQNSTLRFKRVAFRSISLTTISVLFMLSWLLSVGNVILLNELVAALRNPAGRPFGVGLYAFLGGMSIAYFLVLAILRSYVRRRGVGVN